MIVMKFGGSSLESPEAIQRVCHIVKERVPQAPLVVVSAHGATTNRLLQAAREARAGRREGMEDLLRQLREYHHELVRDTLSNGRAETALGAVDDHFDKLLEVLRGVAVLGELTPRTLDTVMSFGERISSRLVALALCEQGVAGSAVDARDYMVTDERHTQAQPNLAATYARLVPLRAAIRQGQVPVLGGFIGATEEGVTSTLGRGGSDFSASIIGAGVEADEIQIWTDVDGVLTSDPRVISNVHRLRAISFAEASELAYFGAKVLHPATMLPAMQKGIPVRVLNSRRPHVEGTRIVPDVQPCRNPVKAIACKKGITVVNVHSTRMLMAHGFLRRMFEVFDRFETPVDMVCTSEVSVSLTLDNTDRLVEIVAELERFSTVSAEGAQATVAIVGDSIRYTPGITARALAALGGVNVRMISQGASLLNLSLVVAEDQLHTAMQALHDEFFQDLDPEVFA
ncbi:MAG: lysine-sensitive aspartokinase 3 [Bryobacterales bacterium]|jgi:aspartate kinase|nr:lysine-sensitive aspartokinase 3 [Bryobacterales bacterium]